MKDLPQFSDFYLSEAQNDDRNKKQLEKIRHAFTQPPYNYIWFDRPFRSLITYDTRVPIASRRYDKHNRLGDKDVLDLFIYVKPSTDSHNYMDLKVTIEYPFIECLYDAQDMVRGYALFRPAAIDIHTANFTDWRVEELMDPACITHFCFASYNQFLRMKGPRHVNVIRLLESILPDAHRLVGPQYASDMAQNVREMKRKYLHGDQVTIDDIGDML
jgi:hypothetical protein